MTKLGANIGKLYFLRAVRSFMLIMPVMVLFFQENGLSMKQVFLLQSFFSLAIILFEVPTGYFSDILGRKTSIIIGTVVSSLGYIVYSLAYGFWGFLSAEIILGLGMSFISGADSALLYDTLREQQRNGEYKRVEGRGLGIGMASESLASVAGGFIALISLRAPLYGEAFVSLLAFPVALTLLEPEKHFVRERENAFKSMARLIKFSLYDHREIKWLIIYSALAGASTLTMVWLSQPYLLAANVPLAYFGVIWSVLLLGASVFSWNAHWIENRLGRKISLILLVLLPATGYFLLGWFSFIWSGIFLVLFYFVRGINNPVMADYINSLVPSSIRATVLSVKNLTGRLMFSVFGPIVGWVNDAYSLQGALFFSGAIFLFLGVVVLFFMRRNEVF